MSTILERLQYGFDRDSRRTWRRRTLATGEDNAYSYDGLSQVTQAALGNLNQSASAIGAVPTQVEAWDYDPTGNWQGYHVETDGSVSLDQHRVHDKGNRLTQIEDDPSPVLLDRSGRMRLMSPDASGNWNESQQMQWDAWGRITQVKRTSDGAILGTYAYDGLTRRATRAAEGDTLHSYYSDQWKPLEERRGAEAVPALQYYWGARHRDDLARRDRATVDGGPLDEVRYVLMDYFSPAAITDEVGALKERYAFSAFGIRQVLAPDFTPRGTSECAFDFAFHGQFLDTESALLNYGYRFYSPYLGRWLAKDPLAETVFLKEQMDRTPKSRQFKLINESLSPLYQFARNSPQNVVDRLGMEVFWVPSGCQPPLSTNFVQVVYPPIGESFVDDGTHGWGSGDLNNGFYPNSKNGVRLQPNGVFVDDPAGLIALLSDYEVCVVCVGCINIMGISLPPGVRSIGPCVYWSGDDNPLFGSFDLSGAAQFPTPSGAWISTVKRQYPNLLPPAYQ